MSAEILTTHQDESLTHHFQLGLTSFQILDIYNGGTHQNKLLQVSLSMVVL